MGELNCRPRAAAATRALARVYPQGGAAKAARRLRTHHLVAERMLHEASLQAANNHLYNTMRSAPIRPDLPCRAASLEQPPRDGEHCDGEHRDAPPRVAPKLPIGAPLIGSPPQERA